MKNPLIVLVLAAIALFVSSCNFEAPKTSFKRYELRHIGVTKADLAFIFDIENTNDIPISVTDIDYSVDLDGSNVTSGSSEGFSLNGRETKESAFPVELSYAKLIGPASGIVQKFIARSGSVSYRITGELTIRDNIGTSARVPLDAEGEIKLF